jgi:hypothetical protein
VILPWIRTEAPAQAAKLAARLDDLARPRAVELLREEPQPVAAGSGGR